jgi:Bacterial mobilisation protein (MobC)
MPATCVCARFRRVCRIASRPLLIQICVVGNGSTHLSTWVAAETKQQFSALAREFGLSESALLKRSITLMLRSTALPESELLAEPAKVPRGLRVYVRLSAQDHRLLGERAAARGMRAARYASFLLRSHLRALAPLPDRELVALTAAIAELGAIGRNINQIARVANLTGRVEGLRAQDLLALLRALEGLRDHVKGLVRSNIASSEVGHAARD